jgi:hypothetical protein
LRTLTLVLLLAFFGFFNLSAQELSNNENITAQELYDFHIEKKKTNNLVGWITLGSGTAMFIAGLSQGTDYVIDTFDPTKEENKSVEWLMIGGGAVMLASIPFFIASGKHKKKAQIQLHNGAVGINKEFKYSGISISFAF